MKLLGLSGSLRAQSLNTKLLREAARVLAPDSFEEADIRLPLFDGDLEAQGIPSEVLKLHGQIAGADAVIISTPEYNKAPSGALKNALDWVSRVKPGPWTGKPVAIMSATAGRSGGERTQTVLRMMLAPFRPVLVPGPEVLIASASSAFDEDGALSDPRAAANLAELMAALRAEVELRGRTLFKARRTG